MRGLTGGGVGMIFVMLGLWCGVLMPGQTNADPYGIAGRTIFLDPGHNGANGGRIYQQVPNGRGGMKACTTNGTATNSGYSEHAFTWDVALRVSQRLQPLGVRTVLSRHDDHSAGPCVNERAALANASHPDAIISLHGDGASPAGHGFHVNYSSPPLNAAQGVPSIRLAEVMRNQMQSSGLSPATYVGHQGLKGRSDLAGLNFAQYPAVLIELGNMKNSIDQAMMESPQGRQRYADALVQGILAFLMLPPS